MQQVPSHHGPGIQRGDLEPESQKKSLHKRQNCVRKAHARERTTMKNVFLAASCSRVGPKRSEEKTEKTRKCRLTGDRTCKMSPKKRQNTSKSRLPGDKYGIDIRESHEKPVKITKKPSEISVVGGSSPPGAPKVSNQLMKPTSLAFCFCF